MFSRRVIQFSPKLFSIKQKLFTIAKLKQLRGTYKQQQVGICDIELKGNF